MLTLPRVIPPIIDLYAQDKKKSSPFRRSESRLEGITAWAGFLLWVEKVTTLPVDADGNLVSDGRWTYTWNAEMLRP